MTEAVVPLSSAATGGPPLELLAAFGLVAVALAILIAVLMKRRTKRDIALGHRKKPKVDLFRADDAASRADSGRSRRRRKRR